MKKIIIISLILLPVLSLVALFSFGPFQLKHPSYLLWVMFGGRCSQEYLEEYVFADCNKSFIIRGLSEAEIRKRFPILFDAEDAPADSNCRQIAENLRKTEFKDKNLKMLLFDKDYSWGWAILLVDGKGSRIDLFKP